MEANFALEAKSAYVKRFGVSLLNFIVTRGLGINFFIAHDQTIVPHKHFKLNINRTTPSPVTTSCHTNQYPVVGSM